ncbi:MAG TPA: hypothetical protein VNR88_02980 [Hyphomicrobium sp.]|nr:hypothetical protein [Hyphomicrobium sp.]
MSRLRAATPIELWCVDLTAAAPALHAIEQHTPRLSADDRIRASSFSDDLVRTEWMATHIALRLLIERWDGARWRGAPYAVTERGKPHLPDAPLSFSISHARGVALIGISRIGSIGVDIERTRNVRIGAPRRERIEAAGAALNAEPLPSEGEGRFLQAWVRLEACAKAEGCGIGRLLTRLGILGSGAAARPDAGSEQDAAGEPAPASVPTPTERHLSEQLSVRDLQLGGGTFAAVAAPGGAALGDIVWLPSDREALENLID